ncbi:NUDIX hydrolase, partial [Xanthomonas vasicola]
SGFRVTPVVAVIDPAFVAVPQPDEVADVFEVSLAYLMDPDNLRSVELEFRGRPRRVLEYDWPGHRIWGATAAILLNLRRRLEQVA